jgi:hypothetical protein
MEKLPLLHDLQAQERSMVDERLCHQEKTDSEEAMVEGTAQGEEVDDSKVVGSKADGSTAEDPRAEDSRVDDLTLDDSTARGAAPACHRENGEEETCRLEVVDSGEAEAEGEGGERNSDQTL